MITKKLQLSFASFALLALSLNNSYAAEDYVNPNLSAQVDLSSYDGVSVANSNVISYSNNQPFILLDGDYANGITITNSSTGQVTATDDGAEIVQAFNLGSSSASTPNNITINNSGIFATHGDHAFPIYLVGTFLNPPSPPHFTPSNPTHYNFNLNNSGSITSDTPFYATVYAVMYDDAGINTINNSGTISGGDRAIDLVGGGSAIINNSGTISGTNNFASSVTGTLYFSGMASAEVTNSGVITAGSVSKNAIFFSDVTSNATVNILDGSLITGKIVGSNHSGVVNTLNIKSHISTNQYNELSGQLVNTWTKNLASGSVFTVANGETLLLAGLNISGGDLNVNGTTTGSVEIGSGSKLSGIGTLDSVTMLSGSTLAAGNSIGTLHVNGNLVLNSGSSDMVEFNAGSMDKVIATGNAIINGNLTLTPYSYSPAAGYFVTSQNIIETSGTVSGSFANVTTQDSNSYVSNIDYGNNYVRATVARKVGSDVLDANILSQNAVGRLLTKSISGKLYSANHMEDKKISSWFSSGAVNSRMDATASSAAYSSSSWVNSAGLLTSHEGLQLVGGFFNSVSSNSRYVYSGSDRLNTNGLMAGIGKNHNTSYGEFYTSSQVGIGFYNFDSVRNAVVNGVGQSAKGSGNGSFEYLNAGVSYKVPTILKGDLNLFTSLTLQKTSRSRWSESGFSVGDVSISKSSANTASFEIGTSYQEEISNVFKLPQGSFYKVEVNGYKTELKGKKNATVSQGSASYALSPQYHQNFSIGGSGAISVPVTKSSTVSLKAERRQNASFRENLGSFNFLYKF